jgi:hypothetical protein
LLEILRGASINVEAAIRSLLIEQLEIVMNMSIYFIKRTTASIVGVVSKTSPTKGNMNEDVDHHILHNHGK